MQIDEKLFNVGMKHHSSFEHKANKMEIKVDKYVDHSNKSKHTSDTTKMQSQFAKAAKF